MFETDAGGNTRPPAPAFPSLAPHSPCGANSEQSRWSTPAIERRDRGAWGVARPRLGTAGPGAAPGKDRVALSLVRSPAWDPRAKKDVGGVGCCPSHSMPCLAWISALRCYGMLRSAGHYFHRIRRVTRTPCVSPLP